MTRRGGLAFFLLLTLLAAFVWNTSAALPEVVASHFGASGAANGFMPRATYRVVMLLLVVGTPLFIALLPAAVISREGSNLNLPHRDYWLAPQRCAATLAFLRSHNLWLAAGIALFLGYLHELVVQANRLRPPHLAPAAIITALVIFLVALGVWLVLLFARFRAPA